MTYAQVVVSMPIADRAVSCRFYQEALGLEPIGEPAQDGIPEPLQFAVNDGLRLMLVPADGFRWVLGPREVAPRTHAESVLGLTGATPAEVDAMVARAGAAGAEVVTAPSAQPWGYTGMFADPDGHLWEVTAVGPEERGR
ncbi:VOC family protein [Micromonosporaceae bacterium DT55]|uniref:VOC family protein n=1 Tax=Melissospora conviva TaxID=3388432 RepID=UPI003C299283